MAAGFTVADEHAKAFREFLQAEIRRQQGGEPILPRLALDGALAVSALTVDLVQELACVAPFGSGNEEPRFAVVDAQIVKADIVGSGHVRCILSGRGGGRAKAIAFKRFKEEGAAPPKGVKMLGQWSRADFNGGFDLLEGDNVEAIAEFALTWSDVLDMTIVPVMEPANVKKILKKTGRW